ncbi:S41 family peptidase [Rhodocytophaga aerolata]|uniref:S41 family peptidase n=2 Tax=Rhodocytophaga aerolata TaxID=455078 RepID=A0ABT8R860_9BACT|nr:S41 family peptidase [Rhodocytophaga aerolata]MDO1447534.1 S41 family peptidase [Rhodocytophaga aerolata]
MAIAISGGIFIGATMFGGSSNMSSITKGYMKYKEILTHIDRDYVDTVNTEDLIDYSIEKMLEKLDPHTVYIPAKDLQMARAQLEGDFDGIGVEFNIFKDTVFVVAPIAGGPSETAGIRAGDKIVEVDGKPMVGKEVDNSTVFSRLRGPKGSKVKIGIKRGLANDLLNFTVTRNKIPTYSIDATYMIDNKTGYIKVNRFAANTYEEFKKAMNTLKNEGMQQLVLDLRGNPGGYMDRATNMADEFIAGNKLIVYTDGKESRYDSRVNAYINGVFEKGPVVVLIDEGSASASEIVAGALQDNDRALIVGRRSFGKGLVQAPIPLEDGSELRLTISRYYTPSGRSIQKPYTHEGEDEDYTMDVMKRYEHGELFHADSIKFNDSLKFQTVKGRTVYGGGGIMPDVFVPLDTSYNTKYLNKLVNANIIREYAFNYYTKNKAELEKMKFEDFKNNFAVTDQMMKDVVNNGTAAGAQFNELEYNRSKEFIRTQLKALIARSVWKSGSGSTGLNNEYYQVMSSNDEVYNQALNLFDRAAEIEKGKVAVK